MTRSTIPLFLLHDGQKYNETRLSFFFFSYTIVNLTKHCANYYFYTVLLHHVSQLIINVTSVSLCPVSLILTILPPRRKTSYFCLFFFFQGFLSTDHYSLTHNEKSFEFHRVVTTFRLKFSFTTLVPVLSLYLRSFWFFRVPKTRFDSPHPKKFSEKLPKLCVFTIVV